MIIVFNQFLVFTGDYYQLLTVLQERNMLNRDQSQYPVNVFQIRDEDRSTPSAGSTKTRTPRLPFDHTWQWFADKMALKLDDDQRVAFAECTQTVNSREGVKMPSIRELEEKPVKKVTTKPRFQNTAQSKLSRISPGLTSDSFDNLNEEKSVDSNSSKDKKLLRLDSASPQTIHAIKTEGDQLMRVMSVDSGEDSRDSARYEPQHQPM